jgi:hypothetical protein
MSGQRGLGRSPCDGRMLEEDLNCDGLNHSSPNISHDMRNRRMCLTHMPNLCAYRHKADSISRSAAGLIDGIIKGSLPVTYCAAARNT